MLILRRGLWSMGAAIFAAACAYTLVFGFGGNPEASTNVAGATVQVLSEQSYNSGFHIGDGAILTAAHAVTGTSEVEVATDTGLRRPAVVEWRDAVYDVALVRLAPEDRPGLATLRLGCLTPQPGDAVEAVGGFPGVDFIRIWGRVAGSPRPSWQWREVLILDMTVVPGMSGGPLLDRRGRVVGINVGTTELTGAEPRPLVAISYSVPGSTICNLMGRG